MIIHHMPLSHSLSLQNAAVIVTVAVYIYGDQQ